jgi:hypothetical protein
MFRRLILQRRAYESVLFPQVGIVRNLEEIECIGLTHVRNIAPDGKAQFGGSKRIPAIISRE